MILTIEAAAATTSHVLTAAHSAATVVESTAKNYTKLTKIIQKCIFSFSPVVLFLLGNVNSQRLRIIVQNDAAIKADRLLKLLQRLEFNITKSLELIRLLVLHQTNILNRQLAEDLNDVALHDSLRQIAYECQKRWLRGQRLLALIVVPGKMHQISYDCGK